jgi:hypothetical protein
MSNGRNKYQSRENRQRVRAALNEHWDPIGVAGNHGLDDEYDSYVGTVYVMLMDRRTPEDAINQYLYETATGHIGLPPLRGFGRKVRKDSGNFGWAKASIRSALTLVPGRVARPCRRRSELKDGLKLHNGLAFACAWAVL